MHEKAVHILSTRPLSPELVQDAARLGVVVDILPFIDVRPLPMEKVKPLLEPVAAEKAIVVFTSMNAVETIAAVMDTQPEWKIYCIGRQTRILVEKYFGTDAIAGTAETAGQLATRILEDGVRGKLYFFCGDRRRDELPGKLREHGIEVDERVVYETKELEGKIDRPYDGILFFSPSAVSSFFRSNKAGEETVLFAIGKTTAEEIRKHSRQRIYISEHAGKEQLLDVAVAYFRPGLKLLADGPASDK
jgi:uroporphyrinogen-III synthase